MPCLAAKHPSSKRRKQGEGDASAAAPAAHNGEKKRRAEDQGGSSERAAGYISHDTSRTKNTSRTSKGAAAERRLSGKCRAQQAAEGNMKPKHNSGTNLDAEVEGFLREMFP